MKRNGFIKTVIIIVIALIVLGYFGFDGEEFLTSDRMQKALGSTWHVLEIIWTDYIVRPVVWIWNEIVIDIVWEKIALPLTAKIQDVIK